MFKERFLIFRGENSEKQPDSSERSHGDRTNLIENTTEALENLAETIAVLEDKKIDEKVKEEIAHNIVDNISEAAIIKLLTDRKISQETRDLIFRQLGNKLSNDFSRLDNESTRTIVNYALLESKQDSQQYRTLSQNLDRACMDKLDLQTIKDLLSLAFWHDKNLYRKILPLIGNEQKTKLLEDEALDIQFTTDLRNTVESPIPQKTPEKAPKKITKKTLEKKLFAKLSIKEGRSINELTGQQLNVLEKSVNKIRETIQNGKDINAIMRDIEKTAKTAYGFLGYSPIEFIEIAGPANIDANTSIIWNLKIENGNITKIANRNTILTIKERQLVLNSQEYQNFLERGKRTATEIETDKSLKDSERSRKYEYNRTYQELTDKVFTVNLDDTDEDNIIENWKSFHDYREVNRIMTGYPFSVDEMAISKKAAAIIAEGWDSEVKFEDIFAQMDGFKAVDSQKIPKEFMRDSAVFLEEFNRLKNNQTPLPEEEIARRDNMFNVLSRCLDLLYALSNLRAKEKQPEPEESKIPETLSDAARTEQEEIYDALTELTEYDIDSSNVWHEFYSLAFEGKHKTDITMADMDGTTFTVSQGTFKDRYNPRAASDIITETPGNYHFENGIKLLDRSAILTYINERIKLGSINIALAEANVANLEDFHSNIGQKMNNLYITDLTELSDEQKEAFQLGFIVAESRKSAAQLSEAAEKNPIFRQLHEKMRLEGVSAEDRKKIEDGLIAAGGITVDTRTGEINGFGAGANILKISDNITISAFGGSFDGNIIVGGKLQINIVNNENRTIAIEIPISIAGIGAGASWREKIGEYNLDIFAGGQLNFENLMPIAGGGIMISVNTEERLNRNLEEAQKQGNLAQIWKEWKNLPKSDIAGKYEKLKTLQPLYSRLQPLERYYGLTKEDIVFIVEGVQDKIKEEVFENTSSSLIEGIPLLSHAGFIMLGVVPVPAVGIEILGAKISIPNRSEISRLIKTASDIRLKNRLEDAVAALDNPENRQQISFVEETPNIMYSRDGKLLSLTNKYEINLDSWLTSPESYNEGLKKAEIQLIELPSGAIELHVLNTQNKDVEIYIDPELKELGVIKDGQHIFLEGNMDDLIISRERFTLPFEQTEDNASIRDIITIRQKSSVEGNRDSSFLQNYSPTFLQKLAHEAYFDIYKANRTKKSTNIFEAPGYSTNKFQQGLDNKPVFTASIKQRRAYQILSELRSHRPEMRHKIDKQDIRNMETFFKNRHESMGNISHAGQIRYNLLPDITALFREDPNFKEKIGENANKPEEIIRLLKRYGTATDGLQNLSETESTMAVTHLLNLWYTDFYKTGAEKAEPNNLEKINRELLTVLDQHIGFIKNRVFIPAFKTAIARINPKPAITAEKAANILIEDTGGELRKIILGDLKKFDYTKDIEINRIPEDAYFFSGSRIGEGQTRKGAITGTIDYKNIEKNAGNLIHDLGFINGTSMSYRLNSPDPEKRAIARILLEIASPIPTDNLEFLNSPLAIKIASMKSHLLLAYSDDLQFEDYKNISKVYQDPSILSRNSDAIIAFRKFKKLIMDIRTAQINGTTFEKRIGSTGLTVRIKIDTKITAGSYSKCANPSFYVVENGHVEILKDNKTIAAFEMSNETVDSDLSKLFRSVGFGVGITESEPPAAPKIKGKPSGVSQTRVSTGETPEQIISSDYE